MKKQKLTPWFDGLVIPCREGWYERMQANAPGLFWYWNGFYWLRGGFPRKGLLSKNIIDSPSITGVLPWRGLASNPKAAA